MTSKGKYIKAHKEKLEAYRKKRLQRMKEIKEKAASRRIKALQTAPLPVSKEGAFLFAVMVAVMAILNDEI